MLGQISAAAFEQRAIQAASNPGRHRYSWRSVKVSVANSQFAAVNARLVDASRVSAAPLAHAASGV
jgi:hypothetical protein